jgi:hypothetical protein
MLSRHLLVVKIGIIVLVFVVLFYHCNIHNTAMQVKKTIVSRLFCIYTIYLYYTSVIQSSAYVVNIPLSYTIELLTPK